MKQLIIPIAIGLLAGIGGGTGFAYMKASQQFAVDSAQVADSLAKRADSTASDTHDAAPTDAASPDGATPDGATPDSAAHDSTRHEPTLPMTPADSLRSLIAARTRLKSEGAHATPATPATASGKDASHDIPVTTKLADVKPVEAKTAPKAEPAKSDPAKRDPSKGSATATAAVAVKDARDVALHTPLPEQRLAKIFAAMAPKDAAKVLDQMSDTDVRSILGLMGDRQAAGILSAFPAARAAAITRGAMKTPEGKE